MEAMVRSAGDCTIITPKVNALDVATVADVKQTVGTKLDLDERFVLDLCEVNFIDSSGVGAMLALKRICSSAGKRLKVAGAQAQVRGQFRSVGLDRLINIHETVEQAVESFRNECGGATESGAI